MFMVFVCSFPRPPIMNIFSYVVFVLKNLQTKLRNQLKIGSDISPVLSVFLSWLYGAGSEIELIFDTIWLKIVFLDKDSSTQKNVPLLQHSPTPKKKLRKKKEREKEKLRKCHDILLL